MTLQLFYQSNLGKNDKEVVFNKDETRHIQKVLRLRAGDTVMITNGCGLLFTAQLLDVSPKRAVAQISALEVAKPKAYRLHMAVAPTKNNDRFEWFLEKATEIGIQSITPIICERSERKVIKPERMERIIESAMKQSLKAFKPTLEPAVKFDDFINKVGERELIRCIAHCGPSEKKLLKQVVQPGEDVLIMIGPEGDFSDREIDLARKNEFTEIGLGEDRLRTETAAIVACHSIAFINS